MGLSTISLIIGIIVGILAIIGHITGFFKRLYKILLHAAANSIPPKTLVLLPVPNWDCRWDMGSVRKQPAMHITGHLYATNTSTLDVRPLIAILKKTTTIGFILIRALDRDIYGKYDIPPKKTTRIIFDFWVTPFCEKGESFVSDVAIVDQFGNKHWIKGVKFSGRQ